MKAYKFKRFDKGNGYTLIELILVIVVLGIISFTFAAFITKGIDAWVFVKTRDSAVGSARYAMNRVITEMRRIAGPESMIIMSQTERSFEAFDKDGNIIIVDFRQSGDVLYRNNDELVDGLLNPGGIVFTYLDNEGVVTAVSSEVRSIRSKLSIEKHSQLVTLESAARIRNL